MKAVFVIFLTVFTTGCAFKQSEPQAKSGGADTVDSGLNSHQSENSVSYRLPIDKGPGKPALSEVIATTSLFRDPSTRALRSEGPLVAPLVVPDILVVDLNVSGVSSDRAGFKGEIRSGARFVREIPAAAFAVKAGNSAEVEFTVTELKSLLPADAQARIEIVVSVLDIKGKSIDTIEFALSTPPSKTSVKLYLPYGRFEKQKQISIPEAFKKVVVSAELQLDLVGVLELANAEADAIEVALPSKLAHVLTRVDAQTQVNIAECSYGLSKTANETKTPSEVRLLPLTADFHRAARESKDAEFVKTDVGPGDVVQIGVYTTDAMTFALPDDRMVSQTVPIRCTAQCQSGAEGDWNDLGKWGRDCIDCGGTPGNVGQNCHNCMGQHRDWCRWQNWRDWKDYSSVSGGFESYLSFSPSEAPSSYLLGFINQKVPGRPRVVFNETIQFKK